jgi:hypothetical protein
MVAEKQDANLVGFYKIREATLGQVPATGNWQTREPNSFDDLGADYTKTARKPFSPSRQRKKGNTTDLDADGGYNEDLTQSNMQTELEEFFFAHLREQTFLSNVAAVASSDDFTVSSSAGLMAGHIVQLKGFSQPANLGIKVLNLITDGTHVSVADALADEAALAGQTLEVVGFEFTAGDVSIALVGGLAVLSGATVDMNDFGLIPGQWVGMGGEVVDDTNSFNLIDPFYARVFDISDDGHTIRFDKTTQPVVTDAGAGKLIRMWFGPCVRNEEDPDLITRFSAVIERTLGRDDDGVQSEYLTGAVASELKWNSPQAGLVNLDLKYIAQKANTRKGIDGPLSARASNTRLPAFGEDAFNTSSNLYRIRMAMVDPATLNPSPYFARVTEWNGMFNNNISSAKAQGVLGGFDTITGNFDVEIEATAYFTTVEAIHAVKCNWDSTFDAIYAKANAGVYIDIPLLSLGGGRLKIEQDAAIMLPLKNPAAESAFGHTALVGWFAYLPDALMPDQDC